MDIIFVRTKLQAHIALKLIDEGFVSKKFIFIKNFWKSIDEDSIQIREIYSEISDLAKFNTFFIEANGTLRNTLFILFLSLIPMITRGKFFFAGINLYSFALTAKLNPFLKIITFDDGSANIRKKSIYFSEAPLPKNKKIGTLIVNSLFKKGAAFYLRQRTSKHFSIYLDKENIVPQDKIELIDLKWNMSLDESDEAIIKKLVKPRMKILIGTTLEHGCNIISLLKRNFENSFDLIILHPRDSSSLRLWKNAFYFESLAESLILYLENSEIVTNLEIYHFSSSVSEALENNKKIKFINIFDQFGIENIATYNEKEDLLVYVDTVPHLNFALEIEKNYSWAKFTYFTNSKEIFNRLDASKDILIQSRLQLLKMFLLKNEKKFTAILVARVDDMNFQLLYKLLSPIKLYTFDEGLFTIQIDSIYNSQNKITRASGIKAYLSNKLFKFPIPASYFYKTNSIHYTSYNKKNFSRSIIDSEKLRYLNTKNDQPRIMKIFIGQPWHYMHFSEKALHAITSFINQVSPDIYLIHPREDLSIIDKNIDINISRIQCHSSSEKFINQLIVDESSEIYTVASTLVLGISKGAKIQLVYSSSFDKKIIFGQQNLEKTLVIEGASYSKIDLD